MISRVAAATAVALLLAGPDARTQTAGSPSRADTGATFDDLARRADAAREAGRLEEAAGLYGQALRQRPRWTQGLWFLGTMAYERDRFADGRDALRRFLALEPKSGPGWALRGLCEFGLRAYAASRRSLDEAIRLGGLDDEAMLRVVLYHQALLRIRASDFEAAIPALTQLATGRSGTPELAQACGLLLLRRPVVPAAIPPADRELVERAGAAYCSYLGRRGDEGRDRYEKLLADYPGQEHLHYGYGLLLAQQGSPEAAAQFRRETELHPGHALAQMELAFELVRRGQARAAIVPARAAVALAPGLFATHLVLGRALVESGNVEGGIARLEEAARLGPGVQETFLALANAYTKAGRPADAQRAREAFKKIESAHRRSEAPAAVPGPVAP